MEQMIKAGEVLENANKVAIMLHGRGADAQGMLSLKDRLNLQGYALFVPQAANHSWYPHSFLAPEQENEPYLSSSLVKVDKVLKEIMKIGKDLSQVYLIGFSQGACLALEYAARNAGDYGGILAFTGGLIGADLRKEKYQGSFLGSPIFLGSSQKDIYVPLARINDSAELLENMDADVKTLTFDDAMHTIRREELNWVNKYILA